MYEVLNRYTVQSQSFGYEQLELVVRRLRVNRHGGQLFAAIAAGTALAICSGLPGIIIRAFEAEKKGNAGGTVIINGVPMTSYVITYLLVGGLGFVAGLILYWLALDVYYYFKQ